LAWGTGGFGSGKRGEFWSGDATTRDFSGSFGGAPVRLDLFLVAAGGPPIRDRTETGSQRRRPKTVVISISPIGASLAQQGRGGKARMGARPAAGARSRDKNGRCPFLSSSAAIVLDIDEEENSSRRLCGNAARRPFVQSILRRKPISGMR